MVKAGWLATVGWCGLLTTPIAAQVTDDPRDGGTDVVVTATPLFDVGEDTLAFPAQTVSDEALITRHASDLTDYLKRISGGVFVNEVQGNPLQPDINYRGFTASPLLGTPQGLSVYLDGVRVNQPFGDVVSWDLIPTSAIRSITLVPGSNPLFGRNSLGGALSVRTKDGASDPGYMIDASYGSFDRRILRGSAGGALSDGLSWFVSGDYFAEDGWRDFSPSEAVQRFGKVRWADGASDLALSGSVADTDLNGNGLQEQRLLKADRASVYTQPDNTRNRAVLLNLSGGHRFSDAVSFSGTAFWRRITTHTLNGDINDDVLGEDIYQPNAEEQAALIAAGVTGFPVAGETQANTPFPRFRCIANVLLKAETNEQCNGLLNRSSTRQREWGVSGELTIRSDLAAGNVLTLGGGYVDGRARFRQSAQFGYLSPERGVVAFADGTQDSEDIVDARVDLSGRTTTLSGYALDALDLTRTLHIDVSARYDRTVVRNRDAITPGGGAGSLDGDHEFGRINPGIAVRWSPHRALSLDAAVAQTSRAPSAIELGCADPESPCRLPNALAGDPPLNQVVARTIEGGLSLNHRGLRARIGAFRTVSRNDILFVAADATGFGYFRNFGRTRRQGIDVDVSGAVGAVTVGGHYTLLDATYRSTENVGGAGNNSNDAETPGFEGNIAIAPGDRIPLIPRHVFKANLGWSPVRAVAINLDMIATSGVITRGNENNAHRADGVYYLGPGKTRGYAVVNAGVEVRPMRDLALYVQINNLLDKNYATAAQLGPTGFDASGNFVARPFDGPVIDGDRPLLSSTFYAPGAPRSIRLGARFSF
ncbi:TonB-dependent receptor [Sphingomonas sp. SUN019]|uniref:TonB-dependent receptor n=1 Tax=Sphingomonas sp. SUN019 TaxID=2937788 RepID=UPI002164E6B5|nr:TonB-dependent receptor [Sphingomonas sp. SUN019]UVO49279.1 TonB-dependent receptor [Sphingomonas sp. SUN019]